MQSERLDSNGEALLPLSPVKPGIPRGIEMVVAFAGLLIFLPLLALAAIGIYLTSPGPILFRQQRVGLKGRHFTIYKFRTMRISSLGLQITAGNDDRITPIGHFLRKTKVDELPELWNILKGDMSFVGPRPEVPRYVEMDDKLWQSVLEARPGLTSPVTMKLRNEEDLLAEVKEDPDRFSRTVLQPYKLHGYAAYLQQRTCWGDIKILAQTFFIVLFPQQRRCQPNRICVLIFC